MGRVSRYKKVKSIDPFAKNGSWKSDVGDCATLRRAKRKSKTALRMKEQKLSKVQRRMRGKKNVDGKKSGGSNGWGNDDGYDLPPEGGDEFDLNDLIESVKKQTHKSNPLLEMKSSAQLSTASSTGDEKWTRKAEKVDLRGVGAASNGKIVDNSALPSKKQTIIASRFKSKAKNDGTLTITAKTPTREIIAACSNPISRRQTNNDAPSASSGLSKQEKRNAFLQKKRSKKRKRGALNDDDDDDDYINQQTLKSLHSQFHVSRAQQKQDKPKKHLIKQHNYSDTLVARTAMDDQVERPPTFTSLPRGANKLNNKKVKSSNTTGEGSMTEEGDHDKSERIRKEQQALELMREKVMKQYAILRESRRNGGR